VPVEPPSPPLFPLPAAVYRPHRCTPLWPRRRLPTARFALACPLECRGAAPAVLGAESGRFLAGCLGTLASVQRSPERFLGPVLGAVATTAMSAVGPAEPGFVLLPRPLFLSFRR